MTEASDRADTTEPPVDTVPGPMLEPAKLGLQRGWFHRGLGPGRVACPGGRRRSVNRRRGQFSLLVVRGDGVRVVRFNFARPLAVAGFLTLAAVVSVMGALVGDWLQLRQLTRESVTFAAQIVEQRKTIDDFNRRVAELRKEVGAWREMQAPAAGTVVFAGTAPEYGNAVIVDHGQDIKSLYGHLSEVSVKPGQKVERGTLLAHTGNTGRSSGPHLHYEILVKGRAVNPRAYLWD